MADKPDKPADSYPSNPWPLLLVVAIVVVGTVLAGFGFWRRGSLLIAGALGIASLLRLVLPRRAAGLLVVRRRWIDVTVLAVMAVATAVVAGVVPGQ